MTTPTLPEEEIGHREALDALPWLVNGTLDPEEAERVRAHLERDPSGVAALDEERRLAAAVAALDVPAPDTAASWRALEARLGAAGPAPRPGGVRRLRSWARTRSPRGRLVLGGGLAAAAVAGALILLPPAGEYGTLTEGAAPAGETSTVELRARPAPGADPAAVREALEAAGAVAVAGPSAGGLLRARVPADEADAALAALRADPLFLVVASD
jgi:hypothetical protein